MLHAARSYANIRSLMVVCVLLSRFPLVAALEGRRELLGQPVALAPEPGRRQVVGEVSPAAEAFGVVAGMRVGEALARCPELRLVPPDPDGVRSLWRRVLDRLERIGAACESDHPGEAFFDADGLRGVHGGSVEGVLLAARRAVGRAARIGCGPGRFSSHAAALRARPGRGRRFVSSGAVVVPSGSVRAFLAPLPVGMLRSRAGLEELPEVLDRLGIRTLEQFAALPVSAVSERFGHAGLLALDLARGRDTPLEPRRPPEPVVERLELPDAALGHQLERALELLVARVLSRPERRGRTLRALALSARFVEGGTWRSRVTLRRASATRRRCSSCSHGGSASCRRRPSRSASRSRRGGRRRTTRARLVEDRSPAAVRRAKIAEAVGQVRQAAGAEAALRVLEVDPDSRLPERRAVLSPYPASDEDRR